MKRLLLVRALLLSALLVAIHHTASTATQPQPEQLAKPLCMPGVYLTEPADCLPLGPSAYLTEMARLGITLPVRPFAASTPDPTLSYLPYSYALQKEGQGAVYATLEDAAGNGSPTRMINAGQGLKFISYIDTANLDDDDKPEAFLLKAGGWMLSRDIATRWGSTPRFQGLVFDETPLVSFGWVNGINDFVETKRTPGFANDDYTGHVLTRYEVVQVYTVEQANGIEWAMIGPEEWVEKRFIGRVIPNPTPPEGVTNGRWIEVNLYDQTVAVYDQNRLVFATLVATGIDPYWTRPGLFQVYQRLESTTMSGSFELDRNDFYYLEDVPWTLYYDGARALHGAYWRTRLGFPQSHGCVNLSPGDARWIFDWTRDGEWVYVWDPSGNTPDDPDKYSDGGA